MSTYPKIPKVESVSSVVKKTNESCGPISIMDLKAFAMVSKI
jgi:hypothetical protein